MRARERKRLTAKSKTDLGSSVRELTRLVREWSALQALLGEGIANRLGVSLTDLKYLEMIVIHDAVTAGEIATASGLTTGAVTGLIDRLERAGVVRRERDALDRRKICVKVLPTALEAAKIYNESLEVHIEQLFESYSENQSSVLIDFFQRSREIIHREIQQINAESVP